ncbi:hypothetical protein [Erysipelothrix anatis]|uniref:hypothetical protein n=1 Tax=Erysipelothrix anatis TaxID=2683713 RepID=UPI00135AB539|nr:hypothetical protein [Erysipelothrix anatis]
MRTIRLMHFVYIVILLCLDGVLNALGRQFLIPQFTFVSNMAFMGLIMLSQNDSREESIIKAMILGIWLEFNYMDSFPIFFVSFALTMLIVRLFDRHIGYSVSEFILLIIVSLFIKEIITYIMAWYSKGYNQEFMAFLAYRSFWVLLGNLMLIPIVRFGYSKMHQYILKKAQNLYMR